MGQHVTLSELGDIALYLLAGGVGAYFLLFARRYRNRQIKNLQRRSTVPFYRAVGAIFLLMAFAGGWAFIRDGVQFWKIIWFVVIASVGLFCLFFSRKYRDWEIHTLESPSQIPAIRILGGFFVLLTVFGFWMLIRTGASMWR